MKIKTIIAISTGFLGLILTFLLIIISIPEAGNVIKNNIPNNDPIKISIEPTSINEGQYSEIPIKLTLSTGDSNITFLELTKDNMIIDRLNKNSQTMVAKGIWKWEGVYNNENIFYCKNEWYSQCNNLMETTAEWNGCENCFMGEEFPYIFTFIIKYREGNEPIKTVTKNIEIPIL